MHDDDTIRRLSVDGQGLSDLQRDTQEARGYGLSLVPLLREKIETAMVVAAEHMESLIVTLNRRAEFVVDDDAAQMRIVVQSEFRHGLVGLTLPITTPRGLALLGLRQGQNRSFEEHGRTRNMYVRRVLYQPEARRFMRDLKRRDGPSAKVIDFIDVRSARASSHQRSRASPIPS